MATTQKDDKADLRFIPKEDMTYTSETDYTERVRAILLAQPLNPIQSVEFRPFGLPIKN